MTQLELRYQQVGDAKLFVEILNHPDFIYFPAKPKTINGFTWQLSKSIVKWLDICSNSATF